MKEVELSERESDAITGDDLKILHALLVAPRAGFASISAVLGVSEPTVSRRYRRLVRRGVVRVVGVPGVGAMGQSRWVLRLTCRPGTAGGLADTLAARADVSWVSVGAGGSELVCVVRSHSDLERDDLLGSRLPRAASVIGVQASVMLHQFQGGRGRYRADVGGALTRKQVAALGADRRPFVPEPIVSPSPVRLDDDDRALVAALAVDGRTSVVELARTVSSTPARVGRRLQLLIDSGALYFDVELSAAALGRGASANLWLRTDPGSAKAVGRALADMPQIGFAAATSGLYNLLAVAYCRDLHELYEFSSDDIGALSGVTALELWPIVRQVKQISARLGPDGLIRADPAQRPHRRAESSRNR